MGVFSVEELAGVIRNSKESGLTVGLCHGCFDIVHIGHIRHFTAARAQCDMLFISVTADRFVNKGPDRPVIPEAERAEVVSSLKVVAGSVINQYPTAVELLEVLRPSLYFKGQEYMDNNDPRFLKEKEIAVALGAEVRFTFEKVCSSSKIIHALRKPTPTEVEQALAESA